MAARVITIFSLGVARIILNDKSLMRNDDNCLHFQLLLILWRGGASMAARRALPGTKKSCAIFCIGLYSMQGAVARRHWPEPAHNVSNFLKTFRYVANN